MMGRPTVFPTGTTVYAPEKCWSGYNLFTAPGKGVAPAGWPASFHINCASYLGPNKWFDEGDERFNPENIIMDSREANIMFIISRKTGKVVWSIGPDYTASRRTSADGFAVRMEWTKTGGRVVKSCSPFSAGSGNGKNPDDQGFKEALIKCVCGALRDFFRTLCEKILLGP